METDEKEIVGNSQNQDLLDLTAPSNDVCILARVGVSSTYPNSAYICGYIIISKDEFS